MMKIWFFEVGMAIEMCKILVWEGERPGKPSVLGGWCLHAGRFVCVLSPTSHCLFANSLKNWTSSLIGAWRGSSCSGICVWYTQKPPPPPSPPPPSPPPFSFSCRAGLLSDGLEKYLALHINFIYLSPNEHKQQQGIGCYTHILSSSLFVFVYFFIVLLLEPHFICFIFGFLLFTQHFIYDLRFSLTHPAPANHLSVIKKY